MTLANGLPRNSFVQSRPRHLTVFSVPFYRRPFPESHSLCLLSSLEFLPREADLISSTPGVAYNFPRVDQESILSPGNRAPLPYIPPILPPPAPLAAPFHPEIRIKPHE